MSKKYKGKTCTYCAAAEASRTGDHVFAREFFPPERRAGLPVVPACERCNNDKSKLEHYLAAVLPFGARHSDGHQVLNEMVEPRLAKNVKLHRELSDGFETVWVPMRGLIVPMSRIPFDMGKLESLCSFIAKGLALHHFGMVIPKDCNVTAGALSAEGERVFGSQLLAMNGKRVWEVVGGGAFEYEGLQSVQDPHVTVWRIKVYGGVMLGGDPKAARETPCQVWVTTSKSDAFARLREKEEVA